MTHLYNHFKRVIYIAHYWNTSISQCELKPNALKMFKAKFYPNFCNFIIYYFSHLGNDTKLCKGGTNSGIMMGQGDIAFVTCPRCRIIKIHPAVSVCTMHRWVNISQNLLFISSSKICQVVNMKQILGQSSSYMSSWDS